MSIEWLRPNENSGRDGYNPQKNVESFIKENGGKSGLILEIFNQIDPNRSYYGEDVNPDEYIGYVERFLSNIREFGDSPTEEQVYSATEGSFFKSSIDGGFVKMEDLKKLSSVLYNYLYKTEGNNS